MANAESRAQELAKAWARRPSKAQAAAIRTFYGRHARELPLRTRAELCLALAEASELEGHFDSARYLYASAVSAVDPTEDEKMYARAALRALLNASRLSDRNALEGVAKLVEKLSPSDLTPRLAGLGAIARGLERFLKEDWTGARRSFEAAMGAAWESHDADGEALAHHLLAQAWSRLGRLARAKEHVEAARAAAAKSGSWLLERRLALESVMLRLLARVTAEGLAEARRILTEVRKIGFPRLESLAWSKLARGVRSDRPHAEAFLSRSEDLLPEGHPDRAFIQAVRAQAVQQSGNGGVADRRLARELDALAKLAKK